MDLIMMALGIRIGIVMALRSRVQGNGYLFSVVLLGTPKIDYMLFVYFE